MSTQVLPALTNAEQIFYDLVWSPMISAGENYLEAQIPVLALPVIKQLDEAGLKLVTDWAFSQIKMFLDITAIKLINAAHQSAYDSASLQLAIIAQEKGIGSDEFKQAREVAKAALSKFTQFSH